MDNNGFNLHKFHTAPLPDEALCWQWLIGKWILFTSGHKRHIHSLANLMIENSAKDQCKCQRYIWKGSCKFLKGSDLSLTMDNWRNPGRNMTVDGSGSIINDCVYVWLIIAGASPVSSSGVLPNHWWQARRYKKT